MIIPGLVGENAPQVIYAPWMMLLSKIGLFKEISKKQK
jgi:hypothetical protein